MTLKCGRKGFQSIRPAEAEKAALREKKTLRAAWQEGVAHVHLPPSNGEVYLDGSPQKRLRVIFDENTERNYVHFPAHNATLRSRWDTNRFLKRKQTHYVTVPPVIYL